MGNLICLAVYLGKLSQVGPKEHPTGTLLIL